MSVPPFHTAALRLSVGGTGTTSSGIERSQVMLEAFRPGESILWDCFWQSTVFLGAGTGSERRAGAAAAGAGASAAGPGDSGGAGRSHSAQGARLRGWGLIEADSRKARRLGIAAGSNDAHRSPSTRR